MAIKVTHTDKEDNQKYIQIMVKHLLSATDIRNTIHKIIAEDPQRIIPTRAHVEQELRFYLKSCGSSHFDGYDDSFYKYDEDYKEVNDLADQYFSELFPDFLPENEK